MSPRWFSYYWNGVFVVHIYNGKAWLDCFYVTVAKSTSQDDICHIFLSDMYYRLVT